MARSRSKAPQDKINRSNEIRRVYQQLGKDAQPKEIIDTLAAEGITVKAGLVNNVLHRERRASGNGKRTRRGGGRPRQSVSSSSETLSVSALTTAKQLLQDAGSLQDAQRALEVLDQLR